MNAAHRSRDQERVSQARPQVPSRRQSQQQGSRGKFKEINEAYQVISDPEKRKKYDELGADWEHGVSQEEMMRRYARQQSAAGAGARRRRGFRARGDFSDFFEQFFGGGGGSARRGGGRAAAARRADFRLSISAPSRARAPDLRAEVGITLADAIKGAKRRLELVAEDECATCGGSGMIAREEKQGKARVIRSAERVSDLRRQRRACRRGARSK